jgi:hypothetical protein
MSRKRKGPRRRQGRRRTTDPARQSAAPEGTQGTTGPARQSAAPEGTQGTTGPARQSGFLEVNELSKAVEAVLTHQTSTSSITEFAGVVVHSTLGQNPSANETTTKDHEGNRFKRWNQDHPPRWGSWLAAFVIALVPILVPPSATAQSQAQPQTTQSETETFGTEVTISVVPTGPPGPSSASGSGPTPGSHSDAEFVDVNLDLSVLAKYMPSHPHALPQYQIRIIADEIATEIHGQLVQDLPGESVPTRIQVGEFVYEIPPLGDSQAISQYISQHFSGNPESQSK